MPDRGGRRRRASSRQAADRAAGDRAGAEIRGRRASRGLAKNDIRGLRRAFSLTFRAGLYPLSVGAAPTGNRATRSRRLLAAVADSCFANAGSGRRSRRRRASSRQAADRAAEIRGRRASRGLAKNDIRGLRRAFSLTFWAGLYPLSGRRRADRQPSDPLAPPA